CSRRGEVARRASSLAPSCNPTPNTASRGAFLLRPPLGARVCVPFPGHPPFLGRARQRRWFGSVRGWSSDSRGGAAQHAWDAAHQQALIGKVVGVVVTEGAARPGGRQDRPHVFGAGQEVVSANLVDAGGLRIP